jgi:hypothetical protein
MLPSAGSWRPAVDSFFILFAHPLEPPGSPTVYRGDDGNVVVYNTSAKAQAAAADLTVTNKHPTTSFTATEIQLSD